MKPLAVFACLTALLLTASAEGQCVVQPRTTFVSTNHVATPVAVVTPVLAATFVNTIPSYSVGYQAGYGGGYGGNDDVGKAILEELKAIRAEQQAIRAALGGGGPLLKANAAVPKGISILANRCATCHDASVAKVKGGDFSLFRGGVFIDEGENAGRVITEVDSGRMPKGGKLSDLDKYEILKFLTVRDAPAPDTTPMPGAKK